MEDLVIGTSVIDYRSIPASNWSKKVNNNNVIKKGH